LFNKVKRDNMKILHTADWHLGKKLETFSRFSEQQELMIEICDIAEKENVDAVLIAGDIFDTVNPPIESIELFYKSVKQLSNNGKRAVIAIAGNHDSPDRLESPDVLARECGIIFSGYPNGLQREFSLSTGLGITKVDNGFIELSLPNVEERLRILLTPYANESRLRTYLGCTNSDEELRTHLQESWKDLADKYCDDKGVNILLSHLFMVGEGEKAEEEGDDEKPILHVGGLQAIYYTNVPKQIQYTALGHLHRNQERTIEDRKFVYAGSPLSYSFGEVNQDKYVMILDVEGGKKAESKRIKLTKGKRLLRYRAKSVNDALKWLEENQNTLVEVVIESDTFISADDRKLLYSSHDGIVSIIPDIKNKEDFFNKKTVNVDLTKNMDDLFEEYFEHIHKQKPNDRIIEVFKEVMGGDK